MKEYIKLNLEDKYNFFLARNIRIYDHIKTKNLLNNQNYILGKTEKKKTLNKYFLDLFFFRLIKVTSFIKKVIYNDDIGIYTFTDYFIIYKYSFINYLLLLIFIIIGLKYLGFNFYNLEFVFICLWFLASIFINKSLNLLNILILPFLLLIFIFYGLIQYLYIFFISGFSSYSFIKLNPKRSIIELTKKI